ncbi:MAG TPA: YciI family protein [Nocardioides sp.]|nr:YciI family protein [Nocardioides sp.]
MTSYVVLLPGDEAAWDNASDEYKQEMYGHHREFARLLAERGHKQTGGAELSTWKKAHAIRRGPNGTALVTDGPYAESAEQLSGFYLVSIDDEHALLDAAQVLVHAHHAVEIRPIESQGDD